MLPHVERIMFMPSQQQSPRFSNTAADAYDESVIERNGWLMYGAKKPDEPAPWTVTRVYECGTGSADVRHIIPEQLWPVPGDAAGSPYMPAGELAQLLSIRDPERMETPLAAAGHVAVAEVLAEREAVKARIAAAAAHGGYLNEASDASDASDASEVGLDVLAELDALAGMLSEARAVPEWDWFRVGMALHNASLASVAGLRLWQRFGSLCPGKFDAAEHERSWCRLGAPMSGDASNASGYTISSLHYWAKEDSPAEYARWKQLRLPVPRGSGSSRSSSGPVARQPEIPWEKQMALLGLLNQSFPGLNLSAAGFRVLGSVGDSVDLAFDDLSAGIRGIIAAPRGVYWGNTVSVTDLTSGEERFLGLLHGSVPVSGPVLDLHNSIPAKAESYMLSQPAANRAVLSSVTPNVSAEITVFKPMDADSSIVISMPGVKDHTVASKNKVRDFKTHVCKAMAEHDKLNLFVNNLQIVTVNAAIGADTRPFVKLRESAMALADAGRLRKLGGHVWRPVPGCPCAYVMAESYREFLNATLNVDPTYNGRPALQRELIEYLSNYNPPQMRDVVFDRGLLSFADGVIVASMDRPEWQFVPYGSDAFGSAVPSDTVARHHIDLPFAPPSTPTPLFDSVVGMQFSPEVSHTMWIMLGRLMFPLGTHDNWQVIPWLVGTAGTGKSLVQDVVAAAFAKATIGALTGNQEQTFGLDGKYNCHVLLGRDLPYKMSSVLAQELMQSMVSAESVCVPRKGLLAVTVRWQVPLLFASNDLPDYADSNGQIVRRLVPFMFDKQVSSPDPTLLQRILATELPAIVSKAMDAYLAAAREHPSTSFWGWCPAELRVAQKEVGIATSYVRRFLAIGPDDDEAVMSKDGDRVYIRHDANVSTPIRTLKDAFTAFMTVHYKDVRTKETINTGTMKKNGYKVDERNVCWRCNRHVTPADCCDAKTSTDRSKLICAVGLSLECVRGRVRCP